MFGADLSPEQMRERESFYVAQKVGKGTTSLFLCMQQDLKRVLTLE